MRRHIVGMRNVRSLSLRSSALRLTWGGVAATQVVGPEERVMKVEDTTVVGGVIGVGMYFMNKPFLLELPNFFEFSLFVETLIPLNEG